MGQQIVRVRQSCIGLSELWVFRDRLAEKLHRFTQPLFRALIQMVAALEYMLWAARFSV